ITGRSGARRQAFLSAARTWRQSKRAATTAITALSTAAPSPVPPSAIRAWTAPAPDRSNEETGYFHVSSGFEAVRDQLLPLIRAVFNISMTISEALLSEPTGRNS